MEKTYSLDWFSYLSKDDILEIEKDINRGLTHSVRITKNEIDTFEAIIDTFPHKIHIREVGGNFPKDIKWLEVYCSALAKFLNVKLLTVKSTRKGVSKLAEKLDFIFNDTTQEFEKVL